MPITWKNVTERAGHELVGARMFEQSREAIGDGLDGIRQMFAAQKANEQAAWQQGKENNTNAALEKLRQYATPEAYAAAQAEGKLGIDPSIGAQIDSQKVNAAADMRLGTLQDQVMKTQQFSDQKAAVAARPLIEQYYTLPMDQRAAFRAANDMGTDQEVAMAKEEYDIARTAERDALNAQQVRSTIASNNLRNKVTQNELTAQEQAIELDKTIGAFNTTTNKIEQDQQSQIAELAQSLGFTNTLPNGDIDYSTGGDAAALQAAIKERGLDQDATGIQRQQAIDAIRQTQGETAAQKFEQATSGKGSPYDSLNTKEKNLVDTEVASIAQNIESAQATVNEAIRLNPLAKSVIDFTGDSSTIYQKVASMKGNTDEVDAVSKDVEQAIKDGVPLPIINLAIDRAAAAEDNAGWNPNANKDDVFRQFITTVMGDSGYHKQMLEALDIQEQQGKINQAKVGQSQAEIATRNRALENLGYRTKTVSKNLSTINSRANEQKKGKGTFKMVNGRRVYD